MGTKEARAIGSRSDLGTLEDSVGLGMYGPFATAGGGAEATGLQAMREARRGAIVAGGNNPVILGQYGSYG